MPIISPTWEAPAEGVHGTNKISAAKSSSHPARSTAGHGKDLSLGTPDLAVGALL